MTKKKSDTDISKAVVSLQVLMETLQSVHYDHSLLAGQIDIILKEFARLQKLEQAFSTAKLEDLTGYDELYYQGWYDAVEKIERLMK